MEKKEFEFTSDEGLHHFGKRPPWKVIVVMAFFNIG